MKEFVLRSTLNLPLQPPNFLPLRMESCYIELFNVNTSITEKYQLQKHESSVLSLKFSSGGDWFVTTGKDNQLNMWTTPHGYSIYQVFAKKLQSTNI